MERACLNFALCRLSTSCIETLDLRGQPEGGEGLSPRPSFLEVEAEIRTPGNDLLAVLRSGQHWAGGMLRNLPAFVKLSHLVPAWFLRSSGTQAAFRFTVSCSFLHPCGLEYLGLDHLLSSQGLLSREVSNQETKVATTQGQRYGGRG